MLEVKPNSFRILDKGKSLNVGFPRPREIRFKEKKKLSRVSNHCEISFFRLSPLQRSRRKQQNQAAITSDFKVPKVKYSQVEERQKSPSDSLNFDSNFPWEKNSASLVKYDSLASFQTFLMKKRYFFVICSFSYLTWVYKHDIHPKEYTQDSFIICLLRLKKLKK